MKKRYVDTAFGRIHVRVGLSQRAGEEPAVPGLLCLHPMPYSGLFFNTITPWLSQTRTVISPDYPGYGASDRLPGLPEVSLWAEAMQALLEALGPSGPVDILGFHTGCLVAAEMALRVPDQVNRLVLVDVPYFDSEKREEYLAGMGAPPVVTPDIESIDEPWRINVASKLGIVSPDRCLALLAEQLRTGTRSNEGYIAAFRYDCAARLAKVTHATLVIGTDSGLFGPSLAAADAIQGARWLPCRELSAPVFESGAQVLAGHVQEFLERA